MPQLHTDPIGKARRPVPPLVWHSIGSFWIVWYWLILDISCSALKKEAPCERVSEVDLLIVCNPEPIERKQPSQPLLVLRTDGRANAGFGTADLVTAALQQAARLREAGVSTLMVDTEQGAIQLGLAQCVTATAGSTCLHLADLAANTFALVLRLSLSGWREGATP